MSILWNRGSLMSNRGSLITFYSQVIKLPPLKKAHRFSKHKGNLRRITKIWHENFPKNKKKTISFIGEKDFPESRSTLDYTCPRAGALGQVKTRVSLDSGKSIFLPMKVIAIKDLFSFENQSFYKIRN